MRDFTILFTFALNFATLASYLVYLAGTSVAPQVLASKDLLLLVGVFLIFPSMCRRLLSGRFGALDWWILLAFFCNVIGYFSSDAPMIDRLFNLRRNISFLLVLLVFRECGTGFKSELSYFSLLKPILLLLSLLGVIEYILPDAFWNDVVGIPAYWDSLAVDPFSTSTIGESGRFYSWDLVILMGTQVRRMVSFYFEPTTMAAFYVACLCFVLIGGKRQRFWIFIIAVVGLLTISKFFALSIPLALGVFLLRDRLHKSMFAGFMLTCVLSTVIVIALEIESGALAHLKGISSLVEIAMQNRWLGFGLGAGGNYADSSLENADLGTESGFGNIAAQLGLMSLVYIALLNCIYTTLLTRYRRSRDPIYAAAIAALLCWTLSFFLSASSLGLSGNAFLFILIGSVLHRGGPVSISSRQRAQPLQTTTKYDN